MDVLSPCGAAVIVRELLCCYESYTQLSTQLVRMHYAAGPSCPSKSPCSLSHSAEAQTWRLCGAARDVYRRKVKEILLTHDMAAIAKGQGNAPRSVLLLYRQ